MGIILDKLTGNPLLIDVKEADLDTALKAKVNQGKIAGIITTTLPSTGIITDKVYEYAGVQGVPITGGTIKDTNGATITTLQTGDSVWYNISTELWYRIPFQSLVNYYTKTEIDPVKNAFEVSPELVTSVTSGYYSSASTDDTTIYPSASIYHTNLIDCLKDETFVIQTTDPNISVFSIIVKFFNASGDYVTHKGGSWLTAITDGYLLKIPEYSLITHMGINVNVAYKTAMSIKKGSSVNDVNLGVLKAGQYKDSVSELTKNSLQDYFFGTNNKIKFIGCVIRTYAHIPFSNGNSEILNGNILTGELSGATYTVHSVILNSGTWNAGDAAGVIVINARKDYLLLPYLSGENLQVGGITKALKTNENAYGGWQQIDSAHQSINITTFITDAEKCTINHNVGATKVVSMVACPDEGWNGYSMGMSVGLNFSFLYVKKLSSNIITGDITGTLKDYTNLDNCVNLDNIWIMGMLLI